MATIPGFELFNGATLSRVVDGAGVVWRGYCAQRAGQKETFGFYVSKDGVDVPISPFCKDRGQVTKDGMWTAWNGSQYYEGPLPGFTPIATGGATGPQGPPGPKGATGPAGPPGVQGVPGHAIAIPPNGMINQLWLTPYTAAECDTGEELAIKLTKNNQIINELVTLLKEAGVLV